MSEVALSSTIKRRGYLLALVLGGSAALVMALLGLNGQVGGVATWLPAAWRWRCA